MKSPPAPRHSTGFGSRRPPVYVGQSPINASDIDGLRHAYQIRQLVLFLGAGVSLEYGIPSWRDLVVDLLFERTNHARRLGDLPPAHRRAFGRWLTEYFDYDLTVLARVIRQDLMHEHRKKYGEQSASEREFLEQVRRRLYATLNDVGACTDLQRPRTSLEAVADLIQASRTENNIPVVLTFNFDNLLEIELVRRGIMTRTITNAGRRAGQGLPIIHPHGCLPVDGPVGVDPIVFTERDYHQLTDVAYHWAPTTIVSLLRQYTVLFVGLSMADPHLRRMLDACRIPGGIPQHWNIQRRHTIDQSQIDLVTNNVERYAKQWARRVGETKDEEPVNLEEALQSTLRQADTYDREVLESMGTKTIWLECFEDLPLLLDQIAFQGSGEE